MELNKQMIYHLLTIKIFNHKLLFIIMITDCNKN